VPPDEDIALEGLERVGGARLYLRRFGTFISKWEKLRKLERETVSLRLWPARPDQCNLGREMQFWPQLRGRFVVKIGLWGRLR
jgi:hypothetical protein